VDIVDGTFRIDGYAEGIPSGGRILLAVYDEAGQLLDTEDATVSGGAFSGIIPEDDPSGGD
jgi:hypothetical protein